MSSTCFGRNEAILILLQSTFIQSLSTNKRLVNYDFHDWSVYYSHEYNLCTFLHSCTQRAPQDPALVTTAALKQRCETRIVA